MLRLFSGSIHYNCTIHKANTDFPYLFMLHGFMGSEKVFEPIIEALKEFCNPVTIDLAGHGQTETPNRDGLLTTEQQVEQLRSILDRLQFTPLYLYGYSMGGRLAFQLISAFPELFTGAIIESAHCGLESENERSERRELDLQRAAEINSDFPSFTDTWLKLPLFNNTPPPFAKLYERIIRSQQPELMSRSLREFGSGIMPAVCKKLPKGMPIHLVSGTLDKKYSALQTGLANTQANIQFHPVSEAGHRIHTDQPDKLIKIIKEAMNPVQIQSDL